MTCSRSAARTASPAAALLEGTTLVWTTPQRRVAPGQSIAFYDISDTELIGGATAA